MATFQGMSILGRGYDKALTNKLIALMEMEALGGWSMAHKYPLCHKNTNQSQKYLIVQIIKI